jgi:hypothetical protein
MCIFFQAVRRKGRKGTSLADQAKEDSGQRLLKDLLVSIAGNQRIKKALLELRDVGGKELVREIVAELEAVVERMRGERLSRLLDPGPLKKPDFDAPRAEPPVPERAVTNTPPPEPIPPVPEHVAPEVLPQRAEAPPRAGDLVSKAPLAAEPPPPQGNGEEAAPAESPPEDRPEGEAAEAEQPTDVEVENEESFVSLTKRHQVRIPVELADDDWLYFHGVSPLSGSEEAAPKPFMMEEKGIDNREFAFALDRGGLRFYLSKIVPGSINVSKNGTVLLNKPDSLRLRGVHAGILNDLRVYGVVLPFEFGTVALGKSHLLNRIDGNLSDMARAVVELAHTKVWHLTVSMLDARLAQMLGIEKPAPQRERDRPSYQQVPQQHRIDIKTMERILNRQKSLAESVHEEISQIAESAKVEMMVGLSSGTSDDWKPILKSKYEVHPRWVPRLNRAVTDLQYRHMLFDLMLALSGEREYYSFTKNT